MTVWRDPSLPHQIVLTFRPGREKASMEVAVTCNCTGLGQLDSRHRWDDPREPMRIWREHMKTNSELSRISGSYPRGHPQLPVLMYLPVSGIRICARTRSGLARQ